MTDYLKRQDKAELAYVFTKGERQDLPAAMFLGGFRSDMAGTKAVYLEEACKKRGQSYLRFDYSGHGVSGGEFEDGTIGSWTGDSLDVLDACLEGQDVILVGSSMGGWISLLVALEKPEQVKGFVGIAAGPDFTDGLYHNLMDDEQRTLMDKQGYIDVPNEYSDVPYRITKALIEDGRDHMLIEKGIDITIPVRLVQGMKDVDVEWQHAHRIKNAIKSDDVEVLLIEDGDHRLSRPQDLVIIDNCVKELSGAA